jgi:hypothetical protein
MLRINEPLHASLLYHLDCWLCFGTFVFAMFPKLIYHIIVGLDWVHSIFICSHAVNLTSGWIVSYFYGDESCVLLCWMHDCTGKWMHWIQIRQEYITKITTTREKNHIGKKREGTRSIWTEMQTERRKNSQLNHKHVRATTEPIHPLFR